MGIAECIQARTPVLMEGALGERLKREYHLSFDDDVAMARLVYDPAGRTALEALWSEYMDIAERYELPFLATTPTRRANRERVALAGCGPSVIADNVAFLRDVRRRSGLEMYVGGLMGCKGDAYTGEGALPEAEAADFHRWQTDLFREAGVDFLFAGIMPTLPEAAGMARAMAETGLPYIISFTIQRDGRLIDGTAIADAIGVIDGMGGARPLCYMTNCVHPSIVSEALAQPWNQTDFVRRRFLGIQGNTSPLPYEELDGAEDLKCSPPEDFGKAMLRLREVHGLQIFGGCCGTDGRHMEQIARGLAQKVCKAPIDALRGVEHMLE